MFAYDAVPPDEIRVRAISLGSQGRPPMSHLALQISTLFSHLPESIGCPHVVIDTIMDLDLWRAHAMLLLPQIDQLGTAFGCLIADN